MNSPSSSTTPSPRLRAQLIPDTAQLSLDNAHNGLDAFLARAELAKLTRALRARLSYASYKATHNLSHVPLQTLEHRQSPVQQPSRTIYHDHRLSSVFNRRDSGSSSKSPTKRRLVHNQLMPPPAAPSLYSAILANSTTAPESSSPTPNKRARHSTRIVPPKASTSSARVSPPAVRTSTRRKKPKATPAAPRSRASTASTRADVEMRDGTTEPEDMSAAAALTSLLHNNAASSGSGPSRPHSPTLSHASSSFESESLSRAPISSSRDSHDGRVLSPPHTSPGGGSTPKHAVDADAAELMLLFATSPSPARASMRRTERDSSSRTNNGRILFSSETALSDVQGTSTPILGAATSFSQQSYGSDGSDSFVHDGNRSKISLPEIILPGELLLPPPSPTLYARSEQNSQDTVRGDSFSNQESAENGHLEKAFIPFPTGSHPRTTTHTLLPSPLSNAFQSKSKRADSFNSTGSRDTPPPSSGMSGSNGSLRQPTFSFTDYLNVSPSSPLRTSSPSNPMLSMTPSSPCSSQVLGDGSGRGKNDSGAASAVTVGRRLFEDDYDTTSRSQPMSMPMDLDINLSPRRARSAMSGPGLSGSPESGGGLVGASA